VVFDNSKVKAAVPDFKCEVNWSEGLRRVLDWFERKPQFKTVDAEFNALCDRIIAGYERAFPPRS
jgi:hypothetical protein